MQKEGKRGKSGRKKFTRSFFFFLYTAHGYLKEKSVLRTSLLFCSFYVFFFLIPISIFLIFVDTPTNLQHIHVSTSEISSEISFNLSGAELSLNHIKLYLVICVCLSVWKEVIMESQMQTLSVSYSFNVSSVYSLHKMFCMV